MATLAGFMTHNGLLTAQQALARVDQFNKVRTLPQQRLLLLLPLRRNAPQVLQHSKVGASMPALITSSCRHGSHEL